MTTATATRDCPECKFENHAGNFFCIQCGALLSCTQPAAGEAADDAGSRDPNPSPETPHEETTALLERVVGRSGYEFKRTTAGYRVVVPLGDDRRQRVHVLFNGRDDDGHDIISFLSICGPADEVHAMNLLRFNGKLTYGSFAVRTIRGREYFVVTANQLAVTADAEEIAKQLFEVARRADAVEAKLSGGRDIY